MTLAWTLGSRIIAAVILGLASLASKIPAYVAMYPAVRVAMNSCGHWQNGVIVGR